MAEHTDHSHHLEAFIAGGIERLGELRDGEAYGAVVIGRAPCGCIGYVAGGLDGPDLVNTLVHVLGEVIRANGGTLTADVRRVTEASALSSTSTAPAS